MSETKTAVGYTRLSDTDSERSIDAQKRAIREYCNDREDLQLEHIYNEGKGASGWDNSREEYQQMLSDAAEGEFDVLVVRVGSRIGRDKMERIDVFTDLANKFEVEFHTTKRGYVDPKNTMDILREVFEATKDDEKKEEIERSIEATEQRQEEGYYHGRAPTGLQHAPRAEPPGLEPDEGFESVLNILNSKEQGMTHDEALEVSGIPGKARSHVTRVLDRKELYQEVASNEGYWTPQ